MLTSPSVLPDNRTLYRVGWNCNYEWISGARWGLREFENDPVEGYGVTTEPETNVKLVLRKKRGANKVNYLSYIVVVTLDILKTGLARRSDVPSNGRLTDPRRGGALLYEQ